MTVNILEESQFALNFLEPFSNCGISFHSYLNFRIENSGMSDTTFRMKQQAFILGGLVETILWYLQTLSGGYNGILIDI